MRYIATHQLSWMVALSEKLSANMAYHFFSSAAADFHDTSAFDAFPSTAVGDDKEFDVGFYYLHDGEQVTLFNSNCFMTI